VTGDNDSAGAQCVFGDSQQWFWGFTTTGTMLKMKPTPSNDFDFKMKSGAVGGLHIRGYGTILAQITLSTRSVCRKPF